MFPIRKVSQLVAEALHSAYEAHKVLPTDCTEIEFINTINDLVKNSKKEGNKHD